MTVDLFVVVPCYNGARFVTDCLNSIRDFSLKNHHINVTCIFVNDGSTDNTKEVIEDYLAKSKLKLFLLNKENGGLCSARNFALDYIGQINSNRDKYVLLLDVDDFVRPIKVKIDESFENNIFDYYINDLAIVISNSCVNRLSQFNPFVVSCIIFKYTELRFDERLTSLEDWDFWIQKFLIEKQSFVINTGAITQIRKIDGSMSSNKKRMRINRVIVSNKYLHMETLNTKHRNNFKVNSFFTEPSFTKIIKSIFLVFPFVFQRNFLALIKFNIFGK